MFTTDRVTAWRDDSGTLVVDHAAPSKGTHPWDVSSITETFQQALRNRRCRQAARIVEWFGAVLAEGPVLDYGCGHQAFLAASLAAGYDATGCDVGVPGLAVGVPTERLIHLEHPWDVPGPGTWTTVVLLDVLEHHPEPEAFLSALGGPRYLVVKVPLLTGPVGVLARAGVRLNRPALMETLLLVDDVSPHLRFFTAAGLDDTAGAAGYVRRRRRNLPDVGAELPDRIRGGIAPTRRPMRSAMAAVGTGLAAVAPVWADTAVFLYERSTPV